MSQRSSLVYHNLGLIYYVPVARRKVVKYTNPCICHQNRLMVQLPGHKVHPVTSLLPFRFGFADVMNI